jgi:putative endonuclease
MERIGFDKNTNTPTEKEIRYYFGKFRTLEKRTALSHTFSPAKKIIFMRSSAYYVYLLKCADNTYYCGITTDLDRRIKEHNTSSLGAKYTKGRRPVILIYSKKYQTRSEAQKEEARIKKLPRANKDSFLDNNA